MNEVTERLKREKVIAILRGLTMDDLVPTARALLDGGISLIEVTFDQSAQEALMRTADMIRTLKERFDGEILPGAGTVMTEEQIDLAMKAGARYVISPHLDEELIRSACRRGLAAIPGAMTPTEIVRAWNAGASAVKVFPAGALGADYIKAVRAPLSHIPLIAVGGVNEKNAGDFLAAGCAAVGAGGSLVNRAWIAEGRFDRITELAREYRKILG